MIFVFKFENNTLRSRHTSSFLKEVKLEDDHVMTDMIKFCNQTIKTIWNHTKLLQKATGQGDDWTSNCFSFQGKF